MGADVDYALLRAGGGPYTFRIHGQNHHLIGSLLPQDGQQPKFIQLYIYDTEHEPQNRIATLDSQRSHGRINEELLIDLQHMLDQFNLYVERF